MRSLFQIELENMNFISGVCLLNAVQYPISFFLILENDLARITTSDFYNDLNSYFRKCNDWIYSKL